MKRLIGFLMAMLMILTLFSTSVFAVETTESNTTTVEDFVIEAGNIPNGVTLSGITQQGNKPETSTITINAKWNNIDVIQMDCQGGSVFTGCLNISGLSIDTSVYKYIKVTYYADVETDSTSIPSADYWKDKVGTEKWELKADISNKTVQDFVGKWNTLVTNIHDVENQWYKFSEVTHVELCLLGQYGKLTNAGKIYIKSITFSANNSADFIDAVAVQKRVDTDNSDNPESNVQDLRFVSVVSDIALEDYSKAWIEVQATTDGQTGNWSRSSTTVYSTLKGGGENYTPDLYAGKYFVALTILDVPIGKEIRFTVTPYLEKNDGTRIKGKSLQLLVEADGSFELDIAYAELGYEATYTNQAKDMQDAILSSKPDLTGKTVYYVSPNGNDNNNGTSPQTAWKTVEKATTVTGSNVAVLFERGGEWRTEVMRCRAGVTYSHYGNESKSLPIINGSKRNYADEALWTAVEGYENIYCCEVSLQNVGVIAFDHDGTLGNYNALTGTRLWERGNINLSYTDLTKDLQFFSDMQNDVLYLYSTEGNPGTRFTSIEIGDDPDYDLINLANGVTIDGLRVQYTGGHAINGGGGLENVTVKNCIISWVGGAQLSTEGTYGNAIQIYGMAKNCNLINNWCYQIYDCGVTIQCTDKYGYDAEMTDCSLSGNLLEYCHWGIEFWNQKAITEGLIRSVQNVAINNNLIRFSGMGWGDAARDDQYLNNATLADNGAAFCCFGLIEDAENVTMKNNVFQLAGNGNALIRMDYYGGEDIVRQGNVYVQYESALMFKLHNGGNYYSALDLDRDVVNKLNEINGKFVIVTTVENISASQKYITGTTVQDAVSYQVGDQVIFDIRLKADGYVVGCDQFKWSLSADDGTSSSGVADGKTGELHLETSISKAGFVYLNVKACDASGNPIAGVKEYHGGAGANIEEIQKIKAEPDDFDEFWEKQLEKLSLVEPELISCELIDAPGFDYHDVYKVKIRFYEGTHGNYVSGYLSVPKNATQNSLSIKMWYNGYGVENPTFYCNNDTALFVVCAHSMEVGQNSSYYSNLKNGLLNGYGFQNNDDPETVYFKEMLLRDVQALRFMKKYFGDEGSDSRFAGLWDGETIITTGGSQGGFQAIAVAALEDGVTKVTAYCPWLCDIGGYGVDGKQDSVFMPEYTAALEYYDTINFAKRLRCDILIGTVGLGDYTTNPAGITALYNSLPNTISKTITYIQNRTHSSDPTEDCGQYTFPQ